MITAEKVIEIHDLILSEEAGLAGHHGEGAIEGALERVQNRIHYEDLDDIYEIAAMYAVAIARGHVFNDANKRTALVTALTYLAMQGVDMPRTSELEDTMVDVASGLIDQETLGNILYAYANLL